MNITFRKLAEKTDLEKLEELESAVWSESSVVPSHMTLTLAKFGGLFLGAFDGDRMIGFLYSFPGYTDQELHLCSHMLGFLPEYRKQGLGVQMKWMQRSEALAEGYRRITWTYDPLETVNAYLNLVKLGGVVHRYIPNCYGELADDMNRGLPTDRFLLDWHIASDRVMQHHAGKSVRPDASGLPAVLFYQEKNGVVQPAGIHLDQSEERLSLPVPAHFQAVKQADMGAAAAWREATRELFTHYFSKGYIVTGICRQQSTASYILEKRSLEDVLQGERLAGAK
ncbi:MULTISPECIES: GNAT family N-acetyltransferase [Brevibacillus]|uniref:N-acetyltransferase domain-containing protein n=1 Tax=Brevibacillus borstelensis AK1 TaxID=1300222 RepID=M8DFB0_9BACL|nr:GNAT family N-acetyltransferase [Brevibacillus borstelensis]EMT52148.1 hypothetical protein I532_14933 [Brevibacillus borstelensis AK1]KKX53477.1 hypothetical protein X546_19030 [Brevibacillus borstelensis cifa_chp40]MBE5394103.1 GNAT family N-acetyltransferase [Brevibacillus borstelensis]MCC0565667.1 GNAT family N-acetyltransferase [Brevibacillus borstelensis]MCM3471466.1 GNAT family N-acetyltransferase [Brevibacillus borstelensis]